MGSAFSSFKPDVERSFCCCVLFIAFGCCETFLCCLENARGGRNDPELKEMIAEL